MSQPLQEGLKVRALLPSTLQLISESILNQPHQRYECAYEGIRWGLVN